MSEVIATQAEKLAIHNRYTATMKEIWGLQPRFEQRSGKRPFGLLTHPRYARHTTFYYCAAILARSRWS